MLFLVDLVADSFKRHLMLGIVVLKSHLKSVIRKLVQVIKIIFVRGKDAIWVLGCVNVLESVLFNAYGYIYNIILPLCLTQPVLSIGLSVCCVSLRTKSSFANLQKFVHCSIDLHFDRFHGGLYTPSQWLLND